MSVPRSPQVTSGTERREFEIGPRWWWKAVVEGYRADRVDRMRVPTRSTFANAVIWQTVFLFTAGAQEDEGDDWITLAAGNQIRSYNGTGESSIAETYHIHDPMLP